MRLQLLTIKIYRYGSPEAANKMIAFLRYLMEMMTWKVQIVAANDITTVEEAKAQGIAGG